VTANQADAQPGIDVPEPHATTTAADRLRAVGNWARDTGLGITGFVVVLIVALAGWTASFIGLHNFGMNHMGLNADTAWLVPITFDGAAAGLSLVVFRASINARGASLWRLLIVVFTALSSWINWEHITDPTGRWIAAFMPPAAVILFEGLMSEARAAAARRDGSERPRVHLLRWFVDRSGTWAIYRAYILGIELPEHLELAARSSQEQAAKNMPEAANNDGQEGRQEAGQDARQETGQETGQDELKRQPTGGQKPRPTRRRGVARSTAKTPAKTRRSMDEWVEIGTPIFHAEFARLRRNPSGTEFAKALAAARHGKPSASTAKNIKTEILDRTELPALD
jgi:hypothetical protein